MSIRNISYYSILTGFTLIGSVVLYLINVTENSTYIDEIFHVNQCKEYCKGNFYKYDPKITTPPGLYIVTISVLLPLSKLLGTDLCSLSILRTVNFTCSILLFVLIHRILELKNFQVQRSRLKEPWLALNLTILPVLYFVSFLYYTDVMSVFFVLMTYYLYNTRRSHSAGFVGLLSTTIRQNNVIWFLCFAFIKCCQNIEQEMLNNNLIIKDAFRKRSSYIMIIVKESFNFMRRSFWSFIFMVLKETYWLIVTVFIFIYFVFLNGSLVLGDKSSHEVVVHIPQLFYFSLFTSIFAFPLCINPCLELLRSNWKTRVVLVLSAFIVTIIVSVNTMAHLFLLSDNRHYTFYIWKRIFEKPYGKFIPVPMYVVSMYCIFKNMSHVAGYVKVGYIISTILCLVPHKLLEFRYFIVPYLLYNIESSTKLPGWQIALQLILNIVINYLTVDLFLWSPFEWSDGTIQRFSW